MLTGKVINNPVLRFNVFIFIKRWVHIIDLNSSKEIEGYERYRITFDAKVYDTKINKYISTWIDTVGYYQCYLRDEEGKKHSKRIHRLVAKAFVPNPDNLPQVNHKDGNKLNNSIDNLEWITNRDNTQHGYDNGLYRYKSRCHAINVYTKQGKYLRTYKSIRSMCDDLHINRKTVTMILKGEKVTNNYDYLFEYVEDSQETIENIA